MKAWKMLQKYGTSLLGAVIMDDDGRVVRLNSLDFHALERVIYKGYVSRVIAQGVYLDTRDRADIYAWEDCTLMSLLSSSLLDRVAQVYWAKRVMQ